MITALISSKGGVGKTTSAVNLAAALAGVGKRVLLVDLDSQASASLSLGVDRSGLAPSIADALLGGSAVADVVRSTAIERVHLATASADLVSADQELAQRKNRELCLRSCLQGIAADYDFILLDCPPSVSLLSLNALAACHNFIVPVVPHFLALSGLEGLMSLSRRLSARCGVRPELLGILLTQVDYRTRAGKANAERIRKRYGPAALAMEIRFNIRLAEAPERGETIFQYDPDSSGAKAYRLLAAEVLMRGRAQQFRRGEVRRRQEAERLRRERLGTPQAVGDLRPLLFVRRASGDGGA